MQGVHGLHGSRPPWERRNVAGHSPLTLSAEIGHKESFLCLLEDLKELEWTYGGETSVLYPLADLDEVRQLHSLAQPRGAVGPRVAVELSSVFCLRLVFALSSPCLHLLSLMFYLSHRSLGCMTLFFELSFTLYI